jgi:uncharacterized protein YyaL (SSP411 family)
MHGMKKRVALLIRLAPCLLAAACTSTPDESASSIRTENPGAHAASKIARIGWEKWSDEAFERARRERRFVVLDLEAVWCHWCHVMEDTTYSDPDVIALMNDRFVAVKVDQDARPDLSNRYEDYGWPATIVFAADGSEIVKRSGYIPPKEFAALLRAIVDDPTPGPSVAPKREIAYASSSAIGDALRAELEKSFADAYDTKLAGFGFPHKYCEAPSVEYAMTLGAEGDADHEAMARRTLDAALALVDPAWGGVYQYSAGGVWTEPHFEKIMSIQSDALRIYALAYALYGDARYLRAAEDVHRYLRDFLTSPQGAFYTSQDADLVHGEHGGEYFALADAERRKRGMPRIDTHVYSRENGWAARALIALYSAGGDERALDEARRALEWIVAARSLSGGGFRHDEVDAAGPYLGDTLAMAQAFLAFYEATGERAWLARADEASKFIAANFADESPAAGFATMRAARGASGPLSAPAPERDENVAAARFENALYHYTGAKEHRALAERAMRFVATPEIALRPFASGPLLADRELGSDPVHVTIVGAKSDPRARALMRAAIACPSSYKRIEWWDAKEGPLPNSDVEYPELEKAAAFACAKGRCSSPAFSPEDVKKRIDAFTR